MQADTPRAGEGVVKEQHVLTADCTTVSNRCAFTISVSILTHVSLYPACSNLSYLQHWGTQLHFFHQWLLWKLLAKTLLQAYTFFHGV